jgi:outer membrane protein assembly factor BamB
MRCLAPLGVAMIDGRKVVKPWPDSIGEWTHFLHGPDNNAVAADTVAGPPRHMQWLAGPEWTRHHHHDKGTHPAYRALVSAKGRLFYVVDEATPAQIRVASRWRLVARDAFSGVDLWKKPLPAAKFPRELHQLWRYIVTDGERVYLPHAPAEPLTAHDAVTGEVVRTYPETAGLEEVILADGTLLAVIEGEAIVAVRAQAGELLWRWKPPDGAGLVPLTLAADAGRVFVKTDTAVYAISARSGKALWRFDPGDEGKRKRLNWPREKLVVAGGVVLVSHGGNDPNLLNKDKWEYMGSHPRVNEYEGKLAALSAAEGKVLWRAVHRPGLESYPGDIFVIDGLVWLGPDFAEGRDLRTGEVKKRNPIMERLWTIGHHHRCYPEKATSRYILNAMRGVEFMDLRGDNHTRCNWVRGTCRIGVTPCNGLVYATPHSCGCQMEAKLNGFWSLAAERELGPAAADAERLENGPAYGRVAGARPAQPDDWPTYRHDPARSGAASTELPSELKVSWRADVGGRPSAPVVAAGRVVVADVDAHRIVCLDAKDGEERWSFTAGARIDSPPTIHEGTVLAGSADGRVYCLRLSDGKLVWRFLAAPRVTNAVALGQVESLWPVHGSVLVKDGIAYVSAGRSSYLDGGISLWGLDAATGEVRSRKLVRSEHPRASDPPSEEKAREMYRRFSQNCTDYKTFTAPDRSDAFSMSGARSDVLVADDSWIYLRQMRFDAGLVRQEKGALHLFSVSSLLDGSEIHRSHWMFGTADFARTPIAYSWIAYGGSKKLSVPFGLMLAFDDRTVWGVRRVHLAGRKKGTPKPKGMYSLVAQERPDTYGQGGPLPDFRNKGIRLKWTAPLAIRPRAMVRSGGALFIGGMAEKYDTKNPAAETTKTFEGEGRGLLYVASTEDGRALGELELDAAPVWDGMAAAGGKLYISTADGRIVCMGPR